MTCSQCPGIELRFDDGPARRELRRYRRRGSAGTARRLLDMTSDMGSRGYEDPEAGESSDPDSPT